MRTKFVWVLALLAVACLVITACAKLTLRTDKSKISQAEALAKIGVVHQAGQYYFDTEKDFLNEGADVIRNELGAKNIKVMMNPKLMLSPLEFYAFNTRWDSCTTLTEIAQTKQFREMFAKDFDTISITAHDKNDYEWKAENGGFTHAKYQETEQELYDLANHLLTTYKNSGKTFIINNWEGDNMLASPNELVSIRTEQEYADITNWFNARNDGILRARDENPDAGVNVYYAIELNRVSKYPSGTNGKWLIDKVLPDTYADLYSYSCWEVTSKNAIKANIELIKAAAPDSDAFGNDNVFIGEMGMREQAVIAESQTAVVKNLIEGAIEAGAPYVYYWQLYCNERVDGQQYNRDMSKYTRPANEGMTGYWLIRADGTYTNTWFYLEGLFKGKTIAVDSSRVKNVPEYYFEFSKSNGIVMDYVVMHDDFEDTSNFAKITDKLEANMSGINFGTITEEQHSGHFSKYCNDRSVLMGNGYIVYERKADVFIVEAYTDIGISSRINFEVSKDGGLTFERISAEELQFPKKDSFWSQGLLIAELDGDVTHIKVNIIAEQQWEAQLTRAVFQKKDAFIKNPDFIDDLANNSKLAAVTETLTASSEDMEFALLDDEAFANVSALGDDRSVVHGEGYIVYERESDFIIVEAYTKNDITQLIGFEISKDGGKTFNAVLHTAYQNSGVIAGWSRGYIKAMLDAGVTHVKIKNIAEVGTDMFYISKVAFQKLDSLVFQNRITYDDRMENYDGLATIGGEIMDNHPGMTAEVISEETHAQFFAKFSADRTVMSGKGSLIYNNKGDIMVIELYSPAKAASLVSMEVSIDGGYTYTALNFTVTESPRHGIWTHAYLNALISGNVTHIRINLDKSGDDTVKVARVTFMGYYENKPVIDSGYIEPVQVDIDERGVSYRIIDDDMTNATFMADYSNAIFQKQSLNEFIADDTYVIRQEIGAGFVIYETGLAKELIIYTASIRVASSFKLFVSLDGGENWVDANPHIYTNGQQVDWQWQLYKYSYTFGEGVTHVKLTFNGTELYDPAILRVILQSDSVYYQEPVQTELEERAPQYIVADDDMLNGNVSESTQNVEYANEAIADITDTTYAKRAAEGAGSFVYKVNGANELIVYAASLLSSSSIEINISLDGGTSWLKANPHIHTNGEQVDWEWQLYKYSYTFGEGVTHVKLIFNGAEIYDPAILRVILQGGTEA